MKKGFIKLFLLVALVFGFSFSLTSCGLEGITEPTGSENTPSTTPSQPSGTGTSQSTTEEEVFEIDSAYYLKLMSEKDSVVIGVKDLTINTEDIRIIVDDESYIKVGISEDKVLMNAYLKGSYELLAINDEPQNLEIWASLNDEEIICKAIRYYVPDFTNHALEDSSAAIRHTYFDKILYKEFSLDKDLVFGYINLFVNEYIDSQFDINTVDSLNDITSLFGVDTKFVNKLYIAGKLESLLTMFFDYVIDENVTWTFKLDPVYEAIDSVKDLTVEQIVDTYVKEDLYSILLTLCNPQNTVNIGKYTLNDLLITSEEDEVGYVTIEDLDKGSETIFGLLPLVMKADLFDIPDGAKMFLDKSMLIGMLASMFNDQPIKKVEVTAWEEGVTYYYLDQDDIAEVDTKTVTAPVAGTDYYVMKDLTDLLTEDALKLTINELAATVYGMFMSADPSFDPSELANFDVTTYIYPMLSAYKDMTVFDILAQIADMNKEEDDYEFVEVEVTAWTQGVYYFTKNDTEYEPVDTTTVTAPVAGTKYYVIKTTTSTEVYEMLIDKLEALEASTVVSFVTDKEAKLSNASVSLDNDLITGTITLDFTKAYTDELHEGLEAYIPYAAKEEEGSIDSFKAIITEDVFADLPDFKLVKNDDNEIIGFEYYLNNAVESTYLFDVPATSEDPEDDLGVEIDYQYGNVWRYKVHMYEKETNGIKSVDELFYDTVTKKFIVKEYKEGAVIKEGNDCSESRVVKYVNKDCENDYYYQVHYKHHHVSEWILEETSDERGSFYKVYIVCDHCGQKALVMRRCDEDDYIFGHEEVNGVDIKYTYYPVKEEFRYTANAETTSQNVTEEYPRTNEVFEGIRDSIGNHKAVKYTDHDNIVIIYIRTKDAVAFNGLIVLDADGKVINRFGIAVLSE